MRITLPLVLVLFCYSRLYAETGPNESSLTLVNDVSFNNMTVTASVPIFGSDSKTSVLSGDITATTDISPVTAFNNQLTFTPGNSTASPVGFSLGNFVSGYVTLNLSNLGISLSTPFAPGNVDASTGIFDASQHDFTIDQGTISVTVPGSNTPTDIQLSETVVTGTGSGNGTVTITENGTTSTRITYNITVTMPFTATTQVPLGFSLGDDEVTATLTFDGTIKATSTVYVYISAYLQWTEENNAPGGAFDSQDIGTIPNGILWALGYDLGNQPDRLIIPVDGKLTIPLPPGGTLHPMIIECSTNLSDWDPIDPSKVSTGSNTIPPASTGTVTITPSGPFSFYRIKATQ
ncbi:MAG: hypothetical protein H7A51_15500 [Akkermansiaceae bacterium]|nr:hypothetical protein [Akkermansiaceae bacterium]